MTSDQYRGEASGGYSNIPKYMFAVSGIDTGDSNRVTDLVQHHNTVSELSQLRPTLCEALSYSATHLIDCAANPTAEEKSIPMVSSSFKSYRKDKSHKCALCIKDKAFTSKNDLDRHLKSRHGVYRKGEKLWYCPVEGCATAGKKWPRLDNFRQHLSNQHGIKSKHGDLFETVKEDRYRSEDHSARIGIKPPPTAIDPQLVDNRSQMSSGIDIASVNPNLPECTPRFSTITRSSPTSAIKSTVWKMESHPLRPALKSSTRAVDSRVVPIQSKSPSSSAPRRTLLAATLPVIEHTQSSDVLVSGDSSTSMPMQLQFEIPVTTNAGDSPEIFTNYWDAQRATGDGSPDTLAGIGSFDDCLTPVLTNSSSTETSNGALRDYTDCKLPDIDFQIIPEFCQHQRIYTRDPIPQLHITPSQDPDILHQSENTLANCFQASKNPGRLLMTPFPDDTEIVMHILNVLQLIPGAVRLIMQRGHQIHPASRDVLIQVIAKYSKMDPEVRLGILPTQQPLPMTTAMAMAPDQSPRASTSLPWSGMKGNHPTQLFFPSQYPTYSQPHFNIDEGFAVYNRCPQMDTPTPTVNTNNQLQRPRDMYQEQLHQAQHHSPLSIFERSQQNARQWEALLANIGSWVQDSQ